MPDREETLISSRIIKLNRLREDGVDPYPPRFRLTCSSAAAIVQFETAEQKSGDDKGSEPSPHISLAGRIVSMRTMGRAAFLDLQDSSGIIQALLRQNVLGQGYDMLQQLDLGDHLGVTGPMIRTRTGQVTIEAHKLVLTSKGMRPLPEKYHGLRDVETRYRQRYLDLIANPEVMPVFA